MIDQTQSSKGYVVRVLVFALLFTLITPGLSMVMGNGVRVGGQRSRVGWTQPYGEEGNWADVSALPTEPMPIWDLYVREKTSFFLPAMTMHNTSVFVTSPDFYLYAIDGQTHAVRWKYNLGQLTTAPPVYAAGIIVAATTQEGRIYALKDMGNSAEVVWSKILGDGVSFALNADEAMVYVGTFNGTFSALNLSTGVVEWRVSLGSEVQGPPAISDGRVCFSTSDGVVHTYTTTGTQLWSFDSHAPIYNAPLVRDGRVYFGNHNGKVYCLDSSTGSEVWSLSLQGPVKSTPALGGGGLYITSGNVLYGLNATGGSGTTDIIGSFNLSGECRTKIIYSNGTVLVYTRDGTVAAINVDPGMGEWQGDRWSVNVGPNLLDAIYSPPVCALLDMDFMASTPPTPAVFVTNGSGYLICLSDVPDLGGGMSDINVVGEGAVYVGERVELDVSVHNYGPVGTTARVEMWEAYPWTMFHSFEVFVGPESESKVRVNWTPERGGVRMIFAKVQSLSIPERNTDNNMYWTQITPQPYPTNVWTARYGDCGGGMYSHGPDVVLNKTAWATDITSYGVEGGGEMTSGPMVYEGRVILALQDGVVVALSTGNGQYMWSTDLDSYMKSDIDITADITAIYDKVFVPTDVGVFALDIYSGSVQWHSATSLPIVHALLYGNGTVIAVDSAGVVYGLKEDTGVMEWSYPLGMDIDGVRYHLPNAQLVAYNKTTVVAFGQEGASAVVYENPDADGISISIDNSTGNSLVNDGENYTLLNREWGVIRSDYSGLHSRASVNWYAHSGAFLGRYSNDIYLYIVETINGTVLARAPVPEGFNTTNALIMQSLSMVYAISGDEILSYVITNHSGPNTSLEPSWTLALPQGTWSIAQAEGKIFLFNGTTVMAIGTTNNPPTAVISAPKDNAIYLDTDNITLSAYGSSDPDGDDLAFTWSSSIDGLLGHGMNISVRLSEGQHTISLEVRDVFGGSDTVSIELTVYAAKISVFENTSISMPYRPQVRAMYGGSGNVSIRPAAEPASLPTGAYSIGQYFDIEAQFLILRWTNISIGYDPSDLGPGGKEANLKIWAFTQYGWSAIDDSYVSVSTKRVWANITHTSTIYTLAYEITNNAPELFNGSVTPEKGDQNTEFNFTVVYKDRDNEAPEYVRLVIGGRNYTMLPLSEGPYSEGVIYYVVVKLEPAEYYAFHFEASDGVDTVTSATITDLPLVKWAQRPPWVSLTISSYVDKLEDGTYVLYANTLYEFVANASDPDGDTVVFYWDFGDGVGVKSGTQNHYSHMFSHSGYYTVRLTASDGTINNTTSIKVKVIPAPKEDNGGLNQAFGDPVVWVAAALILILTALILAYVLYTRATAREEERLKRQFFIEEGLGGMGGEGEARKGEGEERIEEGEGEERIEKGEERIEKPRKKGKKRKGAEVKKGKKPKKKAEGVEEVEEMGEGEEERAEGEEDLEELEEVADEDLMAEETGAGEDMAGDEDLEELEEVADEDLMEEETGAGEGEEGPIDGSEGDTGDEE